MRTRSIAPLTVAGILCAAILPAQDIPLPSGSIKINLGDASPLLIAGTVTDQSRATARGAAMVIDLNLLLQLRNVTPSRQIHGVTLRVVAQEVTLGGKASVAYPGLHIGPGETFPARVKMQLVRPTQAVGSPLVEVNLDGVLFQDLSFYGPDRLNSRRTMTAMEMEAQRDREHFKRVLAQTGPEGLRTAMLDSLTRQAERPRLDVRVTRGAAVTSAANPAPERMAHFAFLQFPDSPVRLVDGSARLAGNEVRAPRVDVRNTTSRVVRYVELGWLVKDPAGKLFMAASLPNSDPDMALRPGQTASVLQNSALAFSREGRPVDVQGMTGFVSQVQFGDGKTWVPERESLEKAYLLTLLPPSAEEQRLTDLYRTKGLNALLEDLKRY